MGYLVTLSNFYTDLCKRAANNEKPETVLTRDNISESFLSFIDQSNDENEGSEYFRKRYEEECNKSGHLELNEFIYTHALFIDGKYDIGAEYLHLKEEAEKYLNLLQSKKENYVAQLKNIGNTKNKQKEKIVYYKKLVEQKINKAKQRSTTEELIRQAIDNCVTPNYIGWFNRGFELDILSAQDIDTDKRDLVYFGELSVADARQMMQLRKINKEAYLDAFSDMILSLHVIEKIDEIAKNNYYLQDREKILHTALGLFCMKNYESFVYLIVPQIEGLFRLYLSLLGDNSISDGMQEIVKKIKEREDFFEFVYFAYDFSDFRNSIAHGEMIGVDREQAYEVIMDTYWIMKEINSDQRDYKLWLELIEKCTECTDLSVTIKQTHRYFTGLDANKYIALLRKHLRNEFINVYIWYNIDNKVDKWDSIIRSKCFYDAIWNEKIPQTYNEITELNGKEFFAIKYNDEGLKYQVLVEELRKYGYVPEDWYKQYITFCDDIKKLKELNYQKNGIAIEDELI